MGCTGLTSVSIPDSIQFVSDKAFKDCNALPVEEGILYAGPYLVSVTDKTLHEYRVKEGTRFVGFSAFSDCRDMTSVILPDSIKRIGREAFRNCRSLTSIVIPPDVVRIEDSTFYNCRSLTSVRIPDGVLMIGDGAFLDCEALTQVNFPNGLQEIESSAFDGCSKLSVIDLPHGVKRIGYRAFALCSNLRSITIPGSVLYVDDDVVYQCSSLREIHMRLEKPSLPADGPDVPESSKGSRDVVIRSRAFNRLDYDQVILYVPTGSEEGYRADRAFQQFKFIIPEIAPSAHTPATVLTANDGKTVTGASNKALASALIPESVTEIAEGAFSGCLALKTVSIPAGVERIGKDAFKNCIALEEIHLRVRKPNGLVIRADAFKDADPVRCTLFVPEGLEDYYSNHPAFRRFESIKGEETE